MDFVLDYKLDFKLRKIYKSLFKYFKKENSSFFSGNLFNNLISKLQRFDKIINQFLNERELNKKKLRTV